VRGTADRPSTATPKSLQNAANAGWMRAVPVSRSWPITSAPARSIRILRRDAAERPEGGGQALAPVVLPLAQRRAHEDPARVAEHRDEEVHLRALAADHDPLLAEVDLELRTRRRLEPHRRELRRASRLAVRLERALQRAQRHVDLALREQPLHDDGVAAAAPSSSSRASAA
jgi:hypothetical protein